MRKKDKGPSLENTGRSVGFLGRRRFDFGRQLPLPLGESGPESHELVAIPVEKRRGGRRKKLQTCTRPRVRYRTEFD